jgi:tetratricopeptide (TPR) repeat protein
MNEMNQENNQTPQGSDSQQPAPAKELSESDKKKILDLRRRAEAAYNKHNYAWASELYGEIYVMDRQKNTEFLQKMLLSSVAEKSLASNALLFTIKQFFLNIMLYVKALKTKEVEGQEKSYYEVWEAILKTDADCGLALLKLSAAYENRGLRENSAMLLETYLRTRKMDIELLRRMGDLYLSCQNVEKARNAYKKILSLKPFDQGAEKKLKDIMALTSIDETKFKGSAFEAIRDKDFAHRSQVEMKVKKTADDLDYLIEAKIRDIEANPSNISLRYELIAYYKSKQDKEGILRVINEIAQLSPGDVNIQLEKMEAQLAALQEKKQGVSPEELCRILNQHKKMAFIALVENFSTSMELKYRLAVVLFDLEENDEALKYFQTTSRVRDYASASMNYMGQILIRKKMLDLAIEQFQDGINIIEDMNDLKKEMIYNLGLVYESVGKNDKALEQYKMIFKIDVGFRDINKRIEAAYQK